MSDQGGPYTWHPTPKDIIQIALKDGLKVGKNFVMQAIALLLFRWGTISTILFVVALIAVPVSLYRRGKLYRDAYRGGFVSYLEITNYLTWTFLGSLVVAFLAYYIAFTMLFQDNTFLSVMEESMALFEQIAKDTTLYQETLEALRGITPLQLVWSMVMNMLIQGVIYIYIISLFIKKRAPLL